MEKRLILALILSFLVVYIYSQIFGTKSPPLKERPEEKEVPLRVQEPLKPALLLAEQGGEQGEEVEVETNLLKVLFTAGGARIKSWRLKEYEEKKKDWGKELRKLEGELAKPETGKGRRKQLEREREKAEEIIELEGRLKRAREEGDEKRAEALENELKVEKGVELVSPEAAKSGIYPLGLWDKEGKELGGIYKHKKEGKRIEFTSRKGNLRIKKTFTFYDDIYKADLLVRIENLSSEGVDQSYLLKWGPGIGREEKAKGGFLGGCASRGSVAPGGEPVSYLKKAGEDKPKAIREKVNKIGRGTRVSHRGEVFWTALGSKYFTYALLPREEARAVVVEKDLEGRTSVGIKMPAAISPGGVTEQRFFLYGGPKKEEDLKEAGLEEVIGFGFFKPIAKILLRLLKFFYKIGKDYGLAIILLSISVKLILTPLTYTSFKSMRAMQRLQPEMNALKEKYKDNPQKMNKEVMKLYREKGVNPLGGCLPLFLQFPIFIALYRVLWNTIELRGTAVPWLWIDDLTSPAIHLVIVMGLTMFLQQKMSTPDPRQGKAMMMMPILFTFIFLSFPAGLVLYWLMYNILSIGEQYFIHRR
jgi:YidC/Oxa1 family membrane protein insertase